MQWSEFDGRQYNAQIERILGMYSGYVWVTEAIATRAGSTNDYVSLCFMWFIEIKATYL